MTTIPQSILDLLRQMWKPLGNYSAFDSTFEDRPRDPSFYIIRRGKEIEYDGDVFSYKEAVSISNDPYLGRFTKQTQDSVAVNEHAAHAIQDFCSEVYDAWRRCEERLDKIR